MQLSRLHKVVFPNDKFCLCLFVHVCVWIWCSLQSVYYIRTYGRVWQTTYRKVFTRRVTIKQFFCTSLFLFYLTFPLPVDGTYIQTWLAIQLPHALPFRIYCPHTLITIYLIVVVTPCIVYTDCVYVGTIT